MMRKLILLMAVIAMVGLAQAELFVNGDFEAGAWSGGGSGSGSWFSWVTMPPAYQTSGGSDGGAWMEFDTTGYVWGPSWDWAWAWSGIWTSDIAVSPGDDLQLSGMSKHIATGSAGNTLRAFISFRDSAGLQVDMNGDGVRDNGNPGKPDRIEWNWNPGDSWEAFANSIIVPTLDLNGDPLASTIALANFTFSVEAEAATVGVDQLSLVPEPMTIGLLGLGALFLRRRKA